MKVRSMLLMLLLAIAAMTSGIAQDDPMAKGRKLYGEEKWLEAGGAFKEAMRQDDRNGQAWFWWGLSMYQEGMYEKAVGALLKADTLGTFRPFARFSVARSYARWGKGEEAYFWLEQAVAAGFGDLDRLSEDEAFDSMRTTDRMDRLHDKIKRNAFPAEYDERYRVMDFWIGEWDVFDRSGTKVGTNIISKEIGGAMLLERWTNVRGISGASINFYDPGTGRFRQQWVSQSGYNTSYEGEWMHGSMVMIGVNADLRGGVSKNRMTFTPNPEGTVTQFIETYDDSTGTWTESFLGTYVRRK